MGRFTIAVVGRGERLHSACFEEFAQALKNALIQLGHEICGFENPGRMIILGAGNMSDDADVMPPDAIIYNTEQVAAEGGERYFTVDEAKKRRVVWDYAKSNVEKLRAMGVPRVVHCPLGYIRSMRTIEPVENEDIDVLFYGSMNARRQQVLDDLRRAGLKVEWLYGVYGAERDAVIARSKVVLNLHFFDRGAIFEIFRCSHLFANRRCVVSENGGQDAELENFAWRATAYVSRQEIVHRCLGLVKSADWRDIQAARGFLEFAETSMVENVRKALEASS